MKTVLAVILGIFLTSVPALAKSFNNAIDVQITTDSGQTLPTYPVTLKPGMSKVYAEAKKGEQYRIVVKNRLNRRVGLVIAVDGRNIISGAKSWLKNDERMYILEPYGSGEFAGWRSSQERINRFYFTDVPDSYAAAFGDKSAMGVIAVSAYPELHRYQPSAPLTTAPKGYGGRAEDRADTSERAAQVPAPSPENKARRAAKAEKSLESAGTGYGHDEYSPTYTVAFEAEKRPVHTTYIKYEWRSTLCRLSVIDCDTPPRRPYNRLWDNNGYAPPPPR